MPPWLPALRAALTRNRRQRTVQIATAGAKTGPTVRTVILRRVDDDGALIFFTDTRSEKVSHLAEEPRVEIHAWWTKGRVQFRLRGRAEVSTSDDDPVRQALWVGLAEEDLVRFHGPPPGSTRTRDERGPVELSTLDGIAESFAVVRVRPNRVDVLRLDPAGHDREVYEQGDEGWRRVPVTP